MEIYHLKKHNKYLILSWEKLYHYPLVKKEANYFNYLSEFLWNFLQVNFQCGISCQHSMGSTYWAIVGDTHSDIVSLYLIYFNSSHRFIHNKERCITACVNVVVTECVK